MTENNTNNEQVRRWMEALHNNGLRLTAPRRAVVKVLANSQRALNAAEIFDQARNQYPSIGLVSVYRALDKLEELSLIQRVHHPDGCHAYIAGFTGHQHLLICRSCNRTDFFEGDNLDHLVSRVSEDSGYKISDHWLQLFGTCPDCRQDSN